MWCASYGGIISKAALCFGFMMPGAKFAVVKMCSDSYDSSCGHARAHTHTEREGKKGDIFFQRLQNYPEALQNAATVWPKLVQQPSCQFTCQMLQTCSALMKGFPNAVDNKMPFNGHKAPYFKLLLLLQLQVLKRWKAEKIFISSFYLISIIAAAHLGWLHT